MVTDRAQEPVLGGLPLDLTQKSDLLDVATVRLAAGYERTTRRSRRRDAWVRPVALVVVAHRDGTAVLHRQARLGAIQRLDLALLIASAHQPVSGWGQIKIDEVFEFLDDLRVTPHLAVLGPVRRQATRLAIRIAVSPTYLIVVGLNRLLLVTSTTKG